MHFNDIIAILALCATPIIAAPLNQRDAHAVFLNHLKREAEARWPMWSSDTDGFDGLGEWLATGKTPYARRSADFATNYKREAEAEAG